MDRHFGVSGQHQPSPHPAKQPGSFVLPNSLENPAVNNVDWYTNTGNASFNAFLAEINHQFAQGFSIDGQYRLSRCMDDGSNNFAVPNYQWIPSTAWGPCDYDATDAFKVFGIWTPRIFHGNDWKEKIIGGWSVSGIFNWHSGFPWTPTTTTLITRTLATSCSPMVVALTAPIVLCFPQPTSAALVATIPTLLSRHGSNFPSGGAAYFTAPSFTPGPDFPNVGPLPGPPGITRNSFRGPRYTDIDATLSKSFGLPNNKILGEHSALEIRANFYNLFNNLNLANVIQRYRRFRPSKFGYAHSLCPWAAARSRCRHGSASNFSGGAAPGASAQSKSCQRVPHPGKISRWQFFFFRGDSRDDAGVPGNSSAILRFQDSNGGGGGMVFFSSRFPCYLLSADL